MNADIKAKWIARLRSGLPQTKSTLHDDKGFCCLGVLCEIAAEEGVIPPPEKEFDELDREVWFYDNSSSILPPTVYRWVGMEYGNPCLDLPNDDRPGLAHLNDTGLTFDQIADLIEVGL